MPRQETPKSRKRNRRPGGKITVTPLPRELREAARANRPDPWHPLHKTRGRWFQSRAAWPHREPDAAGLTTERARAASDLPAHRAASDWSLVGPTNIGGRMTSIICDPTDADHIWAGSAGGGVWESLDGGEGWFTEWHEQESLNVGSLAIDPRNPDRIYCGTGEADLSLDSYAGSGVYRSSDGGRTWLLVADARTQDIPTRIGAIAVDPFDSDHVVLGGIGFTPAAPSGLYDSGDGGRSWIRLAVIPSPHTWCHAVVFHPVEAGTLYAAITELGSGSGIHKSTDGGSSWQRLSAGLPSGFQTHRTSLAISPSEPQILYALIASPAAAGALTADAEIAAEPCGVFRSDDGGDTWEEVGAGQFQGEQQMSYNNTIAVDPTDSDRIICGGVDLHRSTDGGATWQQVTLWTAGRGNPHYAHGDHHTLLIPAADPDRVYSANDGGVDVSFDRGRSWHHRSSGLSTTMYYDIDVSQADGRLFGGGAQDNGTLITTTGSPDDHVDITGGDGGWIVFDPGDVSHIVASIYNMNIFRFQDQEWSDITPHGATPEEEVVLKAERDSMWMVFIAMDPNDGDTLFTGSQRMWRTRDGGDTWQPVSGAFDGGDITAIAVARSDSAVVYAATENGGFFRSVDGGDTWEGNLAGGTLPGVTITRIAVKPNNANLVMVTVANSGSSHVFRSDNGGDTWRDMDRGVLPDAPFHAIAIPASKPRTVFACGDAGVYASGNLGKTWRNLTGSLPTTLMVDLVYQDQDRTLSVATYGRSIWRVDL